MTPQQLELLREAIRAEALYVSDDSPEWNAMTWPDAQKAWEAFVESVQSPSRVDELPPHDLETIKARMESNAKLNGLYSWVDAVADIKMFTCALLENYEWERKRLY